MKHTIHKKLKYKIRLVSKLGNFLYFSTPCSTPPKHYYNYTIEGTNQFFLYTYNLRRLSDVLLSKQNKFYNLANMPCT